MEISVRKLAKLANVSPMSASRALRGCADVSAATRRKVLALARKHRFPLPPARAQETPNLLHTMCSIIALDTDEDSSARGFNRRLLAGVEAGAASCGVETSNINRTYGDPGRFEWPLLVNRGHVDGAVLVLGDEKWLQPTFPTPIPSVCIFYGPPEADVVASDDFGGGLALGQHLYELGHRSVAYLGPETDMSLRRLAGLRAGLDKHANALPSGPHVRIGRGIGGREATSKMIDEILERLRPGETGPDGFTALAVYNDYMAAEAVMHLRERGVRVSEDVSVVGFDNVRPPWYEGPELTTAAMPLEEIGAEAVRMLYWRLAHPEAPARRLLLNTKFVNGASTRKRE